MMRNVLLTFALVAAVLIAQRAAAQGPAGSINSITPAAARHGESVTITGIGFGAQNVTITVAGLAAQVLTANGNEVTFRIPDAAAPGATIVTATIPGGQTGAIGFRVLEGTLLPGSGPAVGATFNLPPVGVDQSLVQNGVILTRIDLAFAPGATVNQINQALVNVQGGIVSMSPGSPYVTIAVPLATRAALEAIAQTLRSSPGVLWAFVGHTLKTAVLPVDISSFQDKHLLPTRFPAAWNAGFLALKNCSAQPKLPVLVADFFSEGALPPAYIGFPAQVPGFQWSPVSAPPTVTTLETHGFDVTTTLAALFDKFTPTGANPFNQCLNVMGVQVGGLTQAEVTDRIVNAFPSGHFIMNHSLEFDPDTLAYDRAALAIEWMQKSSGRWGDFFVAAAAGNGAGTRSAVIYPGDGVAEYGSVLNVATTGDPSFGFITDHSEWDATDGMSPNLTGTNADRTSLLIALAQKPVLFPENNILVTGSVTLGTTFDDLRPSFLSNFGPNLNAVGEQVLTFSGDQMGTSFSAPQVAGLASYLWLLSNDLRNSHPAADTRTAILENARPTKAGKVLDAYASILSLDAKGTPTPSSAPVRLALLDLNGDGWPPTWRLHSSSITDPVGNDRSARRSESKHDQACSSTFTIAEVCWRQIRASLQSGVHLKEALPTHRQLRLRDHFYRDWPPSQFPHPTRPGNHISSIGMVNQINRKGLNAVSPD